MKILADEVSLDAFFERVEGADRPVLLLDYDGTLAPFRMNRNKAVPYPGVRKRLNKVLAQGSTRVVLISGRPVEDVVALAGLDHTVEVWGTHGWEHLRGDGTYVPPDLPAAVKEVLTRAASVITQEIGAPERCEQKPASVAFHVREVSEERANRETQQVKALWTSLVDEQPLAIEPFDGGIELRVEGQDKGDAVCSILTETSKQEVVAYLGDDLTDEDAFEALEGGGLRVLVRPEFRETAADVWLVPPEELLTFLDRWAQAVQ